MKKSQKGKDKKQNVHDENQRTLTMHCRFYFDYFVQNIFTSNTRRCPT